MIDLLANRQVVLQGVELILLDKDGTLIDIHHYWGSMIRRRAATIVDQLFAGQPIGEKVGNALIDALGFDQINGRMKSDGPVGVMPRRFIVDVARRIITDNGVKIDAAAVEDLFQQVDRVTAVDPEPLLRLLPGVVEFLHTCRQNQVQVALVSADKRERIQLALQALRIDHYFTAVIGGDQVENGKPAADPARLAMQICDVPAWKTASIGDHPVDIEMGIRASIPCNIGVLTGLGSRSDFMQQPCHMIQSLQQLSLQPGY
ncbi:MAG: HAD family hydrolase [Candidatus Neomarinimicrobiota bacterium]